MKNILILDTETTGLDPTKGAIVIEIGVILYNVTHKTILQNFSTLLPCAENEAYEINKIKSVATREPMANQHTIKILCAMLDEAQAVVGHNVSFDKKFIASTPKLGEYFCRQDVKWICTKKDFKWPVNLFRNRLEDICKAMGVNYVDAHRALSDCNLLAQCLERVSYLEDALIKAAHNGFTNKATMGGTFR